MARYMLLIYTDPEARAAVDEVEENAIMGEYIAYTQALQDAGVMLAGDALQDVETAKTVAHGGVVTDGPFADVAEHLGGYYLLDVATMEEAVGWAARLPGVARGYDRIEVRPLWEFPDDLQMP